MVEITTTVPAGTDTETTLAHLLEEASLHLDLVAASPERLGASVTWAHITELIDLRMYFRPNELVCTVGSTLLSRRSCDQLVRTLSSVGSAGLCIGLGDVHTRPPEPLVQSCRSYGLPLLALPHGVPFLAINEYLARTRVDTAREASARAERLASLVLARITEGRRGGELIDAAAEIMGGEFAVGGEGGSAGAPSAGSSLDESDPDALMRGGAERFVVEIGGGEFLHWRGPAGVMTEETMLQIARVIAMDERESALIVHERHRRIGQLVDLVGDRLAHPAALIPDLDAAALDGKRITVSLWPPGGSDILAAKAGYALIGEASEAVYLFTPEELSIPELAERSSLICGYSSPVLAGELDRAIQEARAAFSFAKTRGASAGPHELASFDALVEQQSSALLQPFVERYIEPLLGRPGSRGGQELLSTVRAVLEHGSIQQAASASFLHPNTIRYRNERIKELIGKDLLDHADRIDLDIAVRAFDRMRRTRRR